MPSWDTSFNFLAQHANETSLHGFEYIFTRKKIFVVRYWLFVIILSLTTCCFYLTLTAYDHVITKPVVTNIEYTKKETLELPKVLLCPRMINYDEIQKTVGDSLHKNEQLLQLFLIALLTATNPLYSDFLFCV